MTVARIAALASACLDPAAPSVLDTGPLTEADAGLLTEALAEHNVQARIIDGAHIKSKEDLLAALAREFKFPSYFGKNWDALIDSWSDLCWLPARGYTTIFRNEDLFQEAAPKDHKVFLDVFWDISERWRIQYEEGFPFKLVRCRKDVEDSFAVARETADFRGRHIALTDALARLEEGGSRFATVFEHGTLHVEVYAPRGEDLQEPHEFDEVYIVVSGSGYFVNGPSRERFEPGDFLFVPAGVPHRFEDFTGDLTLWVLFYGPEGGEG
jgi:mannose-6-phosphate isomerase-like protein (cupin superfamily)